ncbi:MAG: endonuclease, partial [Syntrophothermus sp.]
MKKSLLLFVALLCSFTHGQIISSTDSIIFPQIKVDSIAQSETYIKSLSTDTTIIFLKSRTNVFSYTDTLILFPNDSALLIINYKPEQNIVDNDFLILLSSDSLYSCIIKLSGSGKFGDSYDNSTFNLYDNQLRTVLSALVSGHTSLGYNLARDKMFESVDDYGGDTIECIYSGTKIKAADRTTAQNLGFNTEHTWPQSNFSEAEPMRSDLNHLFPTLADPNNRRSNYDFGLPVNVTWQSNGSKLGTNVYGQIVFEPRDVTKGDIARAVFYFVTRYQNWGT